MNDVSPIKTHLRTEPYLLYSGGFGTTVMKLKQERPRGDQKQRGALWAGSDNFGNTTLLIRTHGLFAEYAHVLSANTFRMQKDRIPEASSRRAVKIANRGVRNAMYAAKKVRKAKNASRYVAGSYGPIGGTHSAAASEHTFDQLYKLHCDQADRIAKHKPDFMAPEAMGRRDEVIASLKAASKIFDRTKRKIPFILGITLNPNTGKLWDGTSIKDLMADINDQQNGINRDGLVAITINCTPVGATGQGLKELLKYYDGFVGAYANGFHGNPHGPQPQDTAWVHDERPEKIKEFVNEQLLWRALDPKRVKIFGGCCGASPAYIDALGAALAANQQPVERQERAPLTLVASASSDAQRPRRRPLIAESVEVVTGLAASAPCCTNHGLSL